jgi:putative MATE family efflux protein
MDSYVEARLTKSEKKKFYSRLFALGLPLAFQQLVTSLINLLDTFMLGSVSEDVLTAAGLANKLFFVFIVAIYGVTSGAAIFMTRFFGRGDNASLKRYLGISFAASLVLGLLFTIAAVCVPSAVMRLFSSDPAVVGYGVQYLRITGLSYIFTALSVCIYTALKSASHAYIPLIFTLLSFSVNFLFNYIFIFKLNLEIKGAAYATLIARAVEITALVITLKFRKTALSGGVREMFAFSRKEFKGFIAISGFVVFTEAEWAIGTALYNIAFKNYGTSVQAAVQVADTCMILFNVFAIALGTAASVILGQTIGEGKKELAVSYAKKLWVLAIAAGAVMGAAVCALSGVIPKMFPKLTADGAANTRTALLILGAAAPVRCLEFMLMVGIIRSGGDTRFSLGLDIFAVWIVTLPLLLIATYLLGAPFKAVYILMYAEMLLKCVIGSVRMFSGRKWMRELTN